MPVLALQDGFLGLATEPHASRLGAGQASDLLNVDVRDGSLRSRAGFDHINTTTLKNLAAFDSMNRDNTSSAPGTSTSGHVWTAINLDEPSANTISPDVWNGTLRGANEGTSQGAAAVLLNSAGGNAVSLLPHIGVEFDIRKYQGFGTTIPTSRSFASDVVEVIGTFRLVLRSSNGTDLFTGGSLADDSYEIQFTIPLGLKAGVNQTSGVTPNHLSWNTLDISVFKRTASGSTRTLLGSALATADGGPGVDEWIHVRVRVYGAGSTTTIKVDTNGDTSGTGHLTVTDSSSPHTAAGFLKVWFRSPGSVNNTRALKRQIQIANFQVYRLDSAGARDVSVEVPVLRVENIHRHTQANGDAHLLAHALTADGALLVQRPAGDGSTVSAVFYSMQPGFATDNSDSVVTSLKLNRRNAWVTASQPLLSYTAGADQFTIADAETGQKGLGQYTFTAGDRLHLLGGFARTTTDAVSPTSGAVLNVTDTADFKVGQVIRMDPGGVVGDEEIGVIASIQAGVSLTLTANLTTEQASGNVVIAEYLDDDQLDVLTGVYEIESATSAVITIKGAPSLGGTDLSSVAVAYRIISKNQGEGIAPLLNNNTNAASFAKANAMTYVADGSDRPVRMNGEAAYVVGIRQPTGTAILVGNSSGSGFLNGDNYKYRFTWYNELLGLESSASPPSLVVGIVNDAVVRMATVVGRNAFDSNATHVRLYRLNETDSEIQYFRSRTVPIPIDDESAFLQVTDMTADGDQSTTLTIPEQTLRRDDGKKFSDFAVNNPPPAAVLVAWRQDRMFYVTADSTRLWFSASGIPDYVSPFDFVEVGRGDGESIRAIIPFREQLVILKDRSLWVLVGETRGTFQVQRKSNRVACSSHRAVAEADDGLLYFAGELGIHRWNGQFTEDLHYGIRDTYYGLNQDRLKHMAMTVDPEDQILILSVTQTGQTEQDRWLVLNYRRPGIQVEGGVIFDWTLWDLLATCFELDPMVSGASDTYRRKLRFGRTGGIVATFRGDDGTALTDNGTGITWFWEGPKLGLGTGRDKRFKYLTAEFEKVSVASIVSLGYKVDEEASATDITFDQATLTRKVQAVRRRGHYLRPRFSASASTVQTRVLTYAMNFDHIGRR